MANKILLTILFVAAGLTLLEQSDAAQSTPPTDGSESAGCNANDRSKIEDPSFEKTWSEGLGICKSENGTERYTYDKACLNHLYKNVFKLTNPCTLCYVAQTMCIADCVKEGSCVRKCVDTLFVCAFGELPPSK
eukprot:295742_1